MQEINGVRDKIRAEVEDLDGGYSAVAKIMGKTTAFVNKALGPDHNPRLATLEEIKKAVDTAKVNQKERIDRLLA
jgi:DNA-binding phage protein